MSGWGYIFRILKGESPSDVLASMPKKDYDKVASVIQLASTYILPCHMLLD